MKQNGNDASQPAQADDEIVVEEQTLRRLESIKTPGKSYNEILNRVLDDAIKNVPVKDLMTYLQVMFENAVGITVTLHGTENPRMSLITIYTDHGMEKKVSLYEQREARLVIESQTGERHCLPFHVYTTSSGPKTESIDTTPIYMADNALGKEPVTLKQGLNRLQAKIGKPHDEVRELVHDS